MSRYFTLLVLVMTFTFVNAQNLNTGNTFPITKIDKVENSSNLKLVIFTPSLYKTNSYASMLTTSLYYYFVKGFAFESLSKPKIDVIYVVNEEDKWSKDGSLTNVFNNSTNQNKLDGATVIYDEKGVIYNSVGLKPFNQNVISSIVSSPNTSNKVLVESSILFLLDNQNKIIFKDTNYRAQGEHLKPLEKMINKALKINDITVAANDSKLLKVGDKAPDFILNGPDYASNSSVKLLDDKENYKVLTFYPAAFSGQILPDFSSVDRQTAMSCAVQIQLLDHNPVLQKVKSYAISSSTNELLKLWKSALRTNNIKYLNDKDYSISKKYNSYNSLGYDNRATYIIDKNGIIVYANPDFTFEDEAKFPLILEQLVLKGHK